MDQKLLIEIQQFACGKFDLSSEGKLIENYENLHFTLEFCYVSDISLPLKKSLMLLDQLPVLRDSIFDYYSEVFDFSIKLYMKKVRISLI